MNKNRYMPTWSQMITVVFGDEEQTIAHFVKVNPTVLVVQSIPDVTADLNYVYIADERVTHQKFVNKLQSELTELYLLASSRLIITSAAKKTELAGITEDVLKLQNTATNFLNKSYLKGFTRILCKSLPRKIHDLVAKSTTNPSEHPPKLQ